MFGSLFLTLIASKMNAKWKLVGQDFEAVRYEYVTSRGLPTTIGLVFFWRGKTTNLDIQIPGEDRCLNPQTSPELRLWRFLSHRSSPAMTGGFWMSRVIEGSLDAWGGKSVNEACLSWDPWVSLNLFVVSQGWFFFKVLKIMRHWIEGKKPGIPWKGTEKMSNWLWRWQFVVLSLPNFR